MGSVAWLKAASARLRCIQGLYPLSDGIVISPMQRKPKKALQHAAHKITVLCSLLVISQTFLMFVKGLKKGTTSR